MRPIGTPDQLSDRRRKAIALLQQGHRVNETARLVGVTPGAITQWRVAYKQQGEAFFEAHSPPGRACCLSEKQIEQLKKRLLKGARRNAAVWGCIFRSNAAIFVRRILQILWPIC